MRNRQRELLSQLRSVLVGQLHMQPYLIYTDANMEALLDAQPKSIAELEKVKGFPPEGKRIKGFGQSIVDIFTKTERITGFQVAKTEGNEDLSVGASLKEMSIF